MTHTNCADSPSVPVTRRRPSYRQPSLRQDRDGAEIAVVPLAGGYVAKLFAEDWHRLVAMDAHTGWYLDSNGKGFSYVRCGRERFGGLETVARLIVDAGPGDMVFYRDGNRQNLRRDNLRVTHSRKKAEAAPAVAANL